MDHHFEKPACTDILLILNRKSLASGQEIPCLLRKIARGMPAMPFVFDIKVCDSSEAFDKSGWGSMVSWDPTPSAQQVLGEAPGLSGVGGACC